MNTKIKGDLSELKIASRLTEKGLTVSFPFGDRAKYDLIYEQSNGDLIKVQCKHGRLRDGVVIFQTNSITRRSGEKYVSESYKDKVDQFAVYCSKLDTVYLIPIHKIKSNNTMQLRVDKESHPNKNINWAKDYLL